MGAAGTPSAARCDSAEGRADGATARSGGAWGDVEATSLAAGGGADSFVLTSLGSSEKKGAAVGAGGASGGGGGSAAYSMASLLFAASVVVRGAIESVSDARRDASSISGVERYVTESARTAATLSAAAPIQVQGIRRRRGNHSAP